MDGLIVERHGNPIGPVYQMSSHTASMLWLKALDPLPPLKVYTFTVDHFCTYLNLWVYELLTP